MTTTPRGYFTRILALDTETSGLAFNSADPSLDDSTGEQYQVLSIGAIVLDAQTLKILDSLYVEIKFDGSKYKWSDQAEKVHGMSREYLEEHGVSPEEAVTRFCELIFKHWGPRGPIHTAGQNVVTFDIPFMRRLLKSQDIDISFGTRHIDTFSLGYAVFDTYNSDHTFTAAGVKQRTTHTSIEDAMAVVSVLRAARAKVGG